MTGQHCREAGMGLGHCLEKGCVAKFAQSFGDMGFNTIGSGFWYVEGGQDGWDTVSSQSVESSHDQVDRWFILDMSEIGSPPNAKQVNVAQKHHGEYPRKDVLQSVFSTLLNILIVVEDHQADWTLITLIDKGLYDRKAPEIRNIPKERVIRYAAVCTSMLADCQGHSTPCAPRPSLDTTLAAAETQLGNLTELSCPRNAHRQS